MDPMLVTLALLAAGVLLVGVAVRMVATGPETGINSWSRFFLVGLRLVIGWHFLVEGLEKLHSQTWSGETYLRESTGPLASTFRALAGDRLTAKLTVGADHAFPSELEVEWRAYLDGVVDFYQLDEEYAKRARGIYEQARARTLTWLTASKQPVTISATMPPDYIDELTIAERLARHQQLEAAVRALEADIPQYGDQLFKKYQDAKAELANWRSALKRDLNQQFLAFKADVRDAVLVPMLQELAPAAYRGQLAPIERRINQGALAASNFGLAAAPFGRGPLLLFMCCGESTRFERSATVLARAKEKEWLAGVQAVYHQIRLHQVSNDELKLDPRAEKIFVHAFDRKKFDPKQDEQSAYEILPIAPGRPLAAWTLLDWSDAIVKYGLVIVGGCLLIGLLTRTACLAGAGFLLMFFLAMPPLPGWPANPKAEGHYLYINKNVIEMFALLALATMRSGRWAGLDGLVQFLRPGRWRAAAASGSVK
jgi:uncharacterized membrane protein YphA (DoxX/SURF4 family)